MVNPQEQPFTTTSPQLVNYSFNDVLQNTGRINFYCGAARSSAATTYFLTQDVLDSATSYSKLSVASTTSDLDFDFEFTTTQRISGRATVNFTVVAGASNATTTINIYHVDSAATESLLGTGTGQTYNSVTKRECLAIDLADKTFQKGDKLRVNVRLTVSGAGNGVIYFDPSSLTTKTDDDSRTVGTDLIVNIPFILDV